MLKSSPKIVDHLPDSTHLKDPNSNGDFFLGSSKSQYQQPDLTTMSAIIGSTPALQNSVSDLNAIQQQQFNNYNYKNKAATNMSKSKAINNNNQNKDSNIYDNNLINTSQLNNERFDKAFNNADTYQNLEVPRPRSGIRQTPMTEYPADMHVTQQVEKPNGNVDVWNNRAYDNNFNPVYNSRALMTTQPQDPYQPNKDTYLNPNQTWAGDNIEYNDINKYYGKQNKELTLDGTINTNFTPIDQYKHSMGVSKEDNLPNQPNYPTPPSDPQPNPPQQPEPMTPVNNPNVYKPQNPIYNRPNNYPTNYYKPFARRDKEYYYNAFQNAVCADRHTAECSQIVNLCYTRPLTPMCPSQNYSGYQKQEINLNLNSNSNLNQNNLRTVNQSQSNKVFKLQSLNIPVAMKNYSLRIINLIPYTNKNHLSQLHNKYSVIKWSESHFKPLCSDASCGYLLSVTLLDDSTIVRLYQVDASKSHSSYFMEVQIMPSLMDYVLQVERLATASKTAKYSMDQILVKYLDGSMKWVKKELDTLEMLTSNSSSSSKKNTNNNKNKNSMKLVVYIGLDRMVGQVNQQCNVLLNRSCSFSGLNSNSSQSRSSYNQTTELAETSITVSFAQHFNQVVESINKFATKYDFIQPETNYVDMMNNTFNGVKGRAFYKEYEKIATKNILEKMYRLLEIGYNRGVLRGYNFDKILNYYKDLNGVITMNKRLYKNYKNLNIKDNLYDNGKFKGNSFNGFNNQINNNVTENIKMNVDKNIYSMKSMTTRESNMADQSILNNYNENLNQGNSNIPTPLNNNNNNYNYNYVNNRNQTIKPLYNYNNQQQQQNIPLTQSLGYGYNITQSGNVNHYEKVNPNNIPMNLIEPQLVADANQERLKYQNTNFNYKNYNNFNNSAAINTNSNVINGMPSFVPEPNSTSVSNTNQLNSFRNIGAPSSGTLTGTGIGAVTGAITTSTAGTSPQITNTVLSNTPDYSNYKEPEMRTSLEGHKMWVNDNNVNTTNIITADSPLAVKSDNTLDLNAKMQSNAGAIKIKEGKMKTYSNLAPQPPTNVVSGVAGVSSVGAPQGLGQADETPSMLSLSKDQINPNINYDNVIGNNKDKNSNELNERESSSASEESSSVNNSNKNTGVNGGETANSPTPIKLQNPLTGAKTSGTMNTMQPPAYHNTPYNKNGAIVIEKVPYDSVQLSNPFNTTT